MSGYALTLNWERCPDGAELAPHDRVEGSLFFLPNKAEWLASAGGPSLHSWMHELTQQPRIRYRSDRREPYSRRLEAPDDLIVEAFLNAGPEPVKQKTGGTWFECGWMIDFVSEYGLPGVEYQIMRDVLGSKHLHEFRTQNGGLFDRRDFTDSDVILDFSNEPDVAVNTLTGLGGIFGRLADVWDKYAASENSEAVTELAELQEANVSTLVPTVSLRSGRPVITLKASTLYAFMLMETALVVTGGTQITRCQNCNNIFATGPGTGRRNTAKYCSNRCRVAAQRHSHEEGKS